jgi:acyl-CoA synthetase (AMP-forming)/AMP-acid ligase II
MDSRNLLDAICRIAPDRTAVICPGEGEVSYGSLCVQVEALARKLRRAGLGKGDRIALVLPNGIQTVVAFLAAATTATAAPLNPNYQTNELRFYMEDTGARALILPAGADGAARAAAPPGTVLFEIRTEPSLTVTADTDFRLQGTASLPPPALDDIALVLHTSGTTSRPKRVPLKHSNLLASARNIAQFYRLGPDDVGLCVMPLFHVHGLVGSLLSSLLVGAAVVLPPRFNALGFWPLVKSHRVSWYSAVPTIHHMLLSRTRDRGRPAGAEQLRFIRSCSAALAPATMTELEERFGAPVLEAYGMTEAAHQVASNPLPPEVRKPGCVGVGTTVEIAVLDKDCSFLPAGVPGEIALRGPNVIDCYESNPSANAASFVDGWFRTGDEGLLDHDGYLRLIGRIKEIIVRGGEKIAPREIDEVLGLHPAVAEVAAYGFPHPLYGEEVAAAVVLQEAATESDLIAFCRSRMAEFKCPKKLVIVKQIPRTDTGKIQRSGLARQLGDGQSG